MQCVTEHLGVRLPATSPHPSPRQRRTENWDSDFQDTHRLFHHLRHKCVEIECRHRHEELDHLLRVVPLNPWRLTQTGGVFVVQLEEHRILTGVEGSFVSSPAPLYAEWCKAAANSMRTVIRSCHSHERSRRSLLRRAEPTSRSAMSKPTVHV